MELVVKDRSLNDQEAFSKQSVLEVDHESVVDRLFNITCEILNRFHSQIDQTHLGIGAGGACLAFALLGLLEFG